MYGTYKDDFSARGIHEVALLVDEPSRKLVNRRDENFVDGRKPEKQKRYSLNQACHVIYTPKVAG